MKRAFRWAITILGPIILKFHIHTTSDEIWCLAIAEIEIHHDSLIVSRIPGCVEVCKLPRKDRLLSEHFVGIGFP